MGMTYIPGTTGHHRTNGRLRGAGRFPTGIEVMPRKQWVKDWAKSHAPGSHHVTFLGPTGRGKTTLSKDMLKAVISPDYPVIVLHGKIQGRDKVIGKMADELNLRVVHKWPPPPSVTKRRKKINGYILMPLEHSMPTVAEENEKLAQEYRKAIHENYVTTNGEVITHVDESHQAQEDLKLRGELEGPLMRGAPNNSEWNLIQRGKWVTYHVYSAPEDVLIFYDSDDSNQKRYSEIGDVSRDEIIDITSNLRRERAADGRTISQALHIRRAGGMCIVDI